MHVHITQDQRIKALRIYARALPLIAEAVGLSSKALHNNVLRRVLHANLEALAKHESDPESPDEGQKGAGSETGASAAGVTTETSTEAPEDVAYIAGADQSFAQARSVLTNPTIPDGRENEHAEEPDVLQMKPSTANSVAFDERVSAGMVTLHNPRTGEWLHFSGQHLTTERAYAYSGTLPQAKKMRQVSNAAKGLSIVRFVPKGSSL